MSRGEPNVCVKAIRAPFFAAAMATGRQLPELAAEAGIEVTLLGDTTARVPHSRVVHVWDTFAALTADPTFGLTAAAVIGAPRLDTIDYVLQRSGSARELIERFLRYQRLFHDANASTVEELGDACEVRLSFGGDLGRSRHLTEFILATWIARMRALGLHDVRWAAFRHAAAPKPEAYARAFGPDVRFDAGRDGLAIPRAVLDVPLPDGDPAFARAFAQQLERELAELPTGTTLCDVVGRELARALRSGDPHDVTHVARRLALSPRTLQRRLGEEGTSFREVVDRARRELALQTIVRPAANLTDLAFLLGFSEASAFARAFRRWTGQSPTEYLTSR